jgi:hypothetical protein
MIYSLDIQSIAFVWALLRLNECYLCSENCFLRRVVYVTSVLWLQTFLQTPSASTVVGKYNVLYKTKLRGLSPRANYTDRAAAAGRRS